MFAPLFSSLPRNCSFPPPPDLAALLGPDHINVSSLLRHFEFPAKHGVQTGCRFRILFVVEDSYPSLRILSCLPGV